MTERDRPVEHGYKADEDSVYKCFLRKHKQDMKILRIALGAGTHGCLLRALNISAADINFSHVFSSASISFRKFKNSDYNLPYTLRSVFKKAYNIIDTFFGSDPDDPILPEDPKCKKALDLLLRFIMESSNVWDTLYDVDEGHDEWNWSLKLAQHVFTQLSLYPKYKYDINKDYTALGCPCHQGEEILGERDDTSFGWEDGWHGKVDILMADIPVFESGEQDAACKIDTESSVSCEMKNESSFSCETSFTLSDYGQIGAETITFSFLKNKGGNNEISMLPSIAVTKNAVQVHFYDSVNDVFLQSGLVNLIEGHEKFIRPPAILLLWLTLNYKLFYTGIKGTFPKSGLHEMINVEERSREIKAPCDWRKEDRDSLFLSNSWSRVIYFKDEI